MIPALLKRILFQTADFVGRLFDRARSLPGVAHFKRAECEVCFDVCFTKDPPEHKSIPFVDFVAGAQRGCAACDFLYRVIRDTFPELSEGDLGSGWLAWSIDPWQRWRWRRWFFCVPLKNIYDAFSDYYIMNNELRRHALATKYELEFFTLPDAPRPFVAFKICRIASCDTSSEKAIGAVNEWLDHCLDSHFMCNESGIESPRRLPTRLIRVDIDPPYLCITAKDKDLLTTDERARRVLYACLSHRWADTHGRTPTYALQNGRDSIERTIDTYRQGIAIGRLPKTLQDAIEVARNLNVNYIWIDSLCIIQDDEHDKEREISLMSTVYSNAFFTIAANTSLDHTYGLFHSTKECFRGKKFSISDLQDKEFEVYVRKPLEHEMGWSSFLSPEYSMREERDQDWDIGCDAEKEFESNNSSELMTRSWVFQERLLSPRVIQFTPYEVVFECMQEAICECSGMPGAWTFSRNTYQTTSETTGMYIKEKFAHAMWKCAPSPLAMAKLWRELVADYSQTKLSFPKDRLLAISAIAQLFAPLRKGESYIAGLWEHSIIEDLLWFRDETSDFGFKYEPNSSLPSWTWAYRCIPVEYFCNGNIDTIFPIIKQVVCPTDRNNEFGNPITGAYLLLYGQLTPGKIVGNQSTIIGGKLFGRIPLWGRHAMVIFDDKWIKQRAEFSPDVFFLRMAEARLENVIGERVRREYFLVLVCVNRNESLFRRVGVAQIHDEQMKGIKIGSEMEKVVIL